MLLPCPHCRRQFRIKAERIGSHRAKVKCPACNGQFLLDLTPRTKTVPMDSRLLGNDGQKPHGKQAEGLQEDNDRILSGDEVRGLDSDVGEKLPGHDTPAFLAGEPQGLPERGEQPATGDRPSGTPSDQSEFPIILPPQARTTRRRQGPRFLMLWTLLPACCFFLALTAILFSGPWLKTSDQLEQASVSSVSKEGSLSSSVSSQPESTRDPREPNHPADSVDPAAGLQMNDPVVQAFWDPDARDPCEELLRYQEELLETNDQDACRIYPLWITYLALGTESTPHCKLEPVFRRATDAMEEKSLCGPGYAFMSAYYLDKRIIERSQSLLDEALRLAPESPWVKLVEALLHERAYYDDQKGIDLLNKLTRQHPSFSLARYLLAKTYIREEDYEKANGSFEALREDVKGQVAFWRIRRALSVLEEAPDQSLEKAEGLLAMSRAFTVLRDYSMAEHLYRHLLEEMPDRLSTRERMSAYCEFGRICETRGDSNSAYEAYRNALEIDPDCGTAREGISALLARQSPNPS